MLQELRRESSCLPEPPAFLHYRDRDDFEVDIVLQRQDALGGVEVKAGATVLDKDLRGLRKQRGAA